MDHWQAPGHVDDGEGGESFAKHHADPDPGLKEPKFLTDGLTLPHRLEKLGNSDQQFRAGERHRTNGVEPVGEDHSGQVAGARRLEEVAVAECRHRESGHGRTAAVDVPVGASAVEQSAAVQAGLDRARSVPIRHTKDPSGLPVDKAVGRHCAPSHP